jgi:hypothetical protein
MRFNADMKIFYKRLVAAGKAPKAALIAIARKLAVLANTLIREDRPGGRARQIMFDQHHRCFPVFTGKESHLLRRARTSQ